jgi:pectate lyase
MPVPDGSGRFALYVAGNLDDLHRPDPTLPEAVAVDPADRGWLVDTPFAAPPVPTTSAGQAYEEVLMQAGATLPARDPVDVRIVAEVRARSGTIIDHPDQVGGWPRLARGTPPADRDRDGMADDWERVRGLDPTDPEDRNGDLDGDGYTNLEAYLNQLAGDD